MHPTSRFQHQGIVAISLLDLSRPDARLVANHQLLSPESRTPIKASASSAIRLYDSTDTTWGWDAFVPMAKLREDPEIKSKVSTACYRSRSRKAHTQTGRLHHCV